MNFIIYDLEATCWLGHPPKGHNEVIEIGAFKVNPLGEVLDKYSKFVKPTINPLLSGFCKNLTKIKQEDVNRAKVFPVIIEQFMDWIGVGDCDYLLCSWGKYDIQLLKKECEYHGLDTEWLDSNLNLKHSYHKMKGEQKLTGLKNTLKNEGFEFTGQHHRAIFDAENLVKIFIKYIDYWPY